MQQPLSICVFCGASNNVSDYYLNAGKELGKMMAERNTPLVFGGGDCGVMGAVSNSVMANGGKVTGVYPEILRGLEEEHKGLTELITVPDMHTRKMTMFNLADAFVILPGGFGTMDETFEVITWKQLHTHEKPIVLYNQDGYWDHWIAMTNHFMAEKFAGEKTRKLYTIVDDLESVFSVLNVSPPA